MEMDGPVEEMVENPDEIIDILTSKNHFDDDNQTPQDLQNPTNFEIIEMKYSAEFEYEMGIETEPEPEPEPIINCHNNTFLFTNKPENSENFENFENCDIEFDPLDVSNVLNENSTLKEQEYDNVTIMDHKVDIIEEETTGESFFVSKTSNNNNVNFSTYRSNTNKKNGRKICPRCSKKFVLNSSVKHICKIGKEASQAPKYACKLCQNKYFYRDSATRHLKNKHQKEMAGVERIGDFVTIIPQIKSQGNCTNIMKKSKNKMKIEKDESKDVEIVFQSQGQNIQVESFVSNQPPGPRNGDSILQKEPNYACTICSNKYFLRTSVRRHLMNNHKKIMDGVEKISTFIKILSTSKIREIVQEEEVGSMPTVQKLPLPSTKYTDFCICEICAEICIDQLDYNSHLQNAHKIHHQKFKSPAGLSLSCPVCEKEMLTMRSLRMHLIYQHVNYIDVMLEKKLKKSSNNYTHKNNTNMVQINQLQIQNRKPLKVFLILRQRSSVGHPSRYNHHDTTTIIHQSYLKSNIIQQVPEENEDPLSLNNIPRKIPRVKCGPNLDPEIFTVLCTFPDCDYQFKTLKQRRNHVRIKHKGLLFRCTQEDCKNRTVYFNYKADYVKHLQKNHLIVLNKEELDKIAPIPTIPDPEILESTLLESTSKFSKKSESNFKPSVNNESDQDNFFDFLDSVPTYIPKIKKPVLPYGKRKNNKKKKEKGISSYLSNKEFICDEFLDGVRCTKICREQRFLNQHKQSMHQPLLHPLGSLSSSSISKEPLEEKNSVIVKHEPDI